MELASQAMQASKFEDWYWKVQMGKCYFRLGMFRDSEKMFKSALKQQEMIDTFLLLAKVYIRLVKTIQFGKKSRTKVWTFTGLSSLGVPDVPWHTQILADQLTLFQPGGTDYAHLITTGTHGFSELPTAL
jgi:hypothetical protein